MVNTSKTSRSAFSSLTYGASSAFFLLIFSFSSFFDMTSSTFCPLRAPLELFSSSIDLSSTVYFCKKSNTLIIEPLSLEFQNHENQFNITSFPLTKSNFFFNISSVRFKVAYSDCKSVISCLFIL